MHYQTGSVISVPIHSIVPNPAQPRKCFDPEALEELAHSISSVGILQPLTVRRQPQGYELVSGERRLRAAKLAGLKQVPCLLVNMDAMDSGMVALIENIQREDLDYLEEAEGISRLMHCYQLTQAEAAVRLGKSQSAIANKLRLLRHTQAVRDALRKYRLSERHARALLRLPGEGARLSAIGVIAQKNLSVSSTESYIDTLLHPRQSPNAPDVQQLFQGLVQKLQTAGIAAEPQRQEDERQITLTLRIPKIAS